MTDEPSFAWKTLSEVQADQAAKQKEQLEAWNAHIEKVRARVAKIKAENIPAYVPTQVGNTRNVTDYGRARDGYRDGLEAGVFVFSHIACDHCKTELCEDPHEVLLSNPPCRKVCCPGCGFIGYKSL